MSDAANVSSANGGTADLGFDPDALRAKYREERDKRIRVDGNEQYIEVTGDFSRYVDDPYVDPGFTREPLAQWPQQWPMLYFACLSQSDLPGGA